MPNIISRDDAKAAGLTRYFTGKACPKGHIAERNVLSKTCVECMRVRSREISAAGGYGSNAPVVTPADPISISDAKAAGLRYYFTGKSCKKGHVSASSVSSHVCVACHRDGNRERYHARDKEKKREQSRIYSAIIYNAYTREREYDEFMRRMEEEERAANA